MKLRFTRKRSEDKWILKNRKQKQETETIRRTAKNRARKI